MLTRNKTIPLAVQPVEPGIRPKLWKLKCDCNPPKQKKFPLKKGLIKFFLVGGSGGLQLRILWVTKAPVEILPMAT